MQKIPLISFFVESSLPRQMPIPVRTGSRPVPKRNGLPRGRLSDQPKGMVMKPIAIALAATLIFAIAPANAQNGVPSGRGSTTGDPAASSATPGTSPTTGSSMTPSRSGSGTSSSGGRDDNGDQGRDKMPDSTQKVRPLGNQNNPGKK
jgi:hypothetical protein